MTTLAELLSPTTAALGAMHRKQIERAPWPALGGFERERYSAKLRRSAAWQWGSRACAEHGSVHQFAAVARALTELRAPVEFLGAIARLLTDEVRHVQLCADLALTFYPEGREDQALLGLRIPIAPWPDAPTVSNRDDYDGAHEMALRGWAARAILTACAIGETISRPMLEALAAVASDPLAEAASEQILKDEQLHGRFGFEALAYLVPRLDQVEQAALQRQLTRALGGFERTVCGAVQIEELAGREITITPWEAGDAPNLGTLSDEQYAMIFYSCLEHEVFPALDSLGLDTKAAWASRPRSRPSTVGSASPS